MKTDATIQIKLAENKRVPFKEIYSADRKNHEKDSDLCSWVGYKGGNGTIPVISANKVRRSPAPSQTSYSFFC